MHDRLAPGTTLGYCTNVHRGTTYRQILDNLGQHTLAVKARICPHNPMGIGLWLPALVAAQIVRNRQASVLADWLADHGLFVFTLNGFPYHDFHQPIVKHRVYQPDWRHPDRVKYTLDLIAIMADLLLPNTQGSISTLPIAWRSDLIDSPDAIQPVVRNLLHVVDHLAHVEQQTGKLIHLDLEPEPGCFLDTSQDVVKLFTQHLDPVGDPVKTRRYLRVCLDLCHAAVMFEDTQAFLDRLCGADIQVGKVQISSALSIPFNQMTPDDRGVAIEQLLPFQEDRYLHQTVMQSAGAGTTTLYEDLPDALATRRPGQLPSEHWRVHYHLPLFLERLGHLQTTQSQVKDGLAILVGQAEVQHFEVETYTWDVLPEGIGVDDLSHGIAQEFSWLFEQIKK